MPEKRKGHMLHNYKTYDLYKMYNKYEKSFIFSKKEKSKWYCYKYKYIKDGRLIWGEIKENQQIYGMPKVCVWQFVMRPKKKNELVIKQRIDEPIIITFI